MKFIPHAYQKYNIHRLLAEPVQGVVNEGIGLFLDMGLG